MNSDVDQIHIADKKSCALKSWARTMGDQIGAEMRLGAPPLEMPHLFPVCMTNW